MGKQPKSQTREKIKEVAEKVKEAANTADKVVNTVARGVKVVKAITGMNDRSWYTRYSEVTPAANMERPMDALFNTSITKDATEGAATRYVDVQMSWTGFPQTNMFDTVINTAFQRLRMELKSNLPYDMDFLKCYMTNSISLAILWAMKDRDIHWNMFADPQFRDWQQMFPLKGENYNGQPHTLYLDEDLDTSDAGKWASVVALYDRSVLNVKSNILLPSSLANFINHYFKMIFIDQADGYATQIYRNMMHLLPWTEYDYGTKKIIYSTIDANAINVRKLNEMTLELGKQFSIVLADLNKSSQMISYQIEASNAGSYSFCYDRSYHQALINAYTSDSLVTSDGYVRLDRIIGVKDELTQYLFMGALYPSSLDVVSENGIPNIVVEAMILKLNSNSILEWPSDLFNVQGNNNYVNDLSEIKWDKPIAFPLSTDMIGKVNVSVGLNNTTSDNANAVYPLNIGGRTYAVSVAPNGANFDNQTITYQSKARITLSKNKRVSVAISKDENPKVWLILPIFTFKATATSNSKMYYIREISYSTADNDYKVTSVPARWDVYLDSNANDADPIGEVEPFGLYSGDLPSTFTKVVMQTGPKLTNEIEELISNLDNWHLSRVSLFSSDKFNLWADLNFAFLKNGMFAAPYTADITLYTPSSSFFASNSNVTYLSFYPASRFAEIGEFFWAAGVGSVNSISTQSNLVNIRRQNLGLVPWAIDQVDYHVPINYRTYMYITTNSSFGGDPKNDYSDTVFTESGNCLVKETYAPYYYNVKDLVPVIYNMFSSLFYISNPGDAFLKPAKNTKK